MSTTSLGRLLVQEGLLTEIDCKTITDTCGSHSAAFAKGVIALGLLEDEELASFIASRTLFGLVPLDIQPMARDSPHLSLNSTVIRLLEAVPIDEDNERIRVVVADPLDRALIRQLEFFSGKKIRVSVAPLSQIHQLLIGLFPDYSPPQSPVENILGTSGDAAETGYSNSTRAGASSEGGIYIPPSSEESSEDMDEDLSSDPIAQDPPADQVETLDDAPSPDIADDFLSDEDDSVVSAEPQMEDIPVLEAAPVVDDFSDEMEAAPELEAAPSYDPSDIEAVAGANHEALQSEDPPVGPIAEFAEPEVEIEAEPEAEPGAFEEDANLEETSDNSLGAPPETQTTSASSDAIRRVSTVNRGLFEVAVATSLPQASKAARDALGRIGCSAGCFAQIIDDVPSVFDSWPAESANQIHDALATLVAADHEIELNHISDSTIATTDFPGATPEHVMRVIRCETPNPTTTIWCLFAIPPDVGEDPFMREAFVDLLGSLARKAGGVVG